jgi:hypothetical protein
MWVPHSSNFAIQSRDLGSLAPETIHVVFLAMFHNSHMGRSTPDRLEISHLDAIARYTPDYQGVFADQNAPQAACTLV